MLRVLLKIVRNESDDEIPFPPTTLAQEKTFEKSLKTEVPCVYDEPFQWLWHIPQDIVTHLAAIQSSQDIVGLAQTWLAACQLNVESCTRLRL